MKSIQQSLVLFFAVSIIMSNTYNICFGVFGFLHKTTFLHLCTAPTAESQCSTLISTMQQEVLRV
jgi:hypothetical protein